MTNSIPLADLETSPAAKFDNLGDAYRGRIVAMDQRAQTDINTGAVRTWADGTPRMQWVITIEQANGERVALWARGGKYAVASGQGESMLSAIGTAVRAAGAQGVDVGADLAVQFSGMGEASVGKNAPKLYVAQYRAPGPATVPVDLFSE